MSVVQILTPWANACGILFVIRNPATGKPRRTPDFMAPIPLPFTDNVLRLSGPFAGFSLPLQLILAGVVCLGVVGLLLWLYRAELRIVSPRVARVLLSLRLMGVAILLLMLLLEPSISRTVTEDLPGRVMIAVDRSESMQITDPNRTTGEKLRIAKLLKLIPPELASERELDFWAGQSVGDAKPRFLPLDTETPKRFEKVLEIIDSTSRLQIATRVLNPDGLGLVEGLREKQTVELFGFGQDLAALPLDPTKLQNVLVPPVGSPPPPKTLFTDLKLPLNRASETVADRPDDTTAKLLGIILLTDGRHNWGDSPTIKARELGQREVPIYPIAIAPKDPPADVAVVLAKAQASTVFKGSIVPIEVAVRVAGWPQGKIVVKLELPDKPDGSKTEPLSETIEHDGRDALYPLTFKTTMDEPGPQRMVVSATTEAIDRFPENNTRSTRVNVVKDRAKVMLIDGESRWEFHYLHTCLGRDPNMDIRSIVFRQPRVSKISDEELRRFGTPARKLPDDLEVLSSYDCIMIGDVDYAQMTAAQRDAIEKYVAESGGTLVLYAGKRAMPSSYAELENEPFRKLLPIKNPKPFEVDDGFPLNITPEGERSWFLSMGDTGPENRRAWDRLPFHYWATIGELKDGAEVLAAVPGGNARERAVIARQSYGFGRVLYVGIDSTWRWRFKVGDYFHHRFWGQVAQWAASDRLLPVTNAAGTIRFGTREPVYNGGQDVEVVVRTAEAIKKLTPNALKGAKVIRLPNAVGGKESSVGLTPLNHPEGRPRDLMGKLKDLPPGKYVVELEIPEWADQLQGPPGTDGRAGPLRCPFEIVPPDQEELVELSANLPLLEDLAAAGNGKVHSIETARELIETLATQTVTREYYQDQPIRQSWWTLTLLIGLLSVEWGLRKWSGLP